MTTLTRKQREIKAREGLILKTAARLLGEHGYLGLTMDQIAEATEYSKGTIYNHFRSKEEVLVALCIQTGQVRVGWFERAARFHGGSRERMTAIGASVELFVRLHPQHFACEQIVTAESIREKISPERAEKLLAAELGCMDTVRGIVRDAVDQGDLVLPEGTDPTSMVFGLWSMTYGGLSMIAGKPTLTDVGLSDPLATLRRNQQAFMDGHGWLPQTDNWDFDATRARVLEEIFPDEARRAGLT
jgi:AcrR family transcriptional regulator